MYQHLTKLLLARVIAALAVIAVCLPKSFRELMGRHSPGILAGAHNGLSAR